jgi:molecular chaperone GrpE (heat shock protein)
MAIVHVYNRARGVTYVYESQSYWDKELKQPRSNRKLIGKLDPDTGEIVPTGKKGRTKQDQDPEKKSGYSVTDSKTSADQTRRLLKEKDAEILSLKKQLSAAEREIANYRQLIQQAHAILGKAAAEGR